jgi:anti-sigma regulatory factor (Ser/Thr protein kinase)
LRDLVQGRLDATGLRDLPLAKFLLAVHEAAVNVVVQGGGSGRLWLWLHGDSLWCEINDDGPGRPTDLTAPARPPDTHALTGRGLWLINEVCTSLDITTAHWLGSNRPAHVSPKHWVLILVQCGNAG